MGNTWKVVAAFIGVFVAGSVFGGFFALGVGQRVIQSRRPATPPTDPMLLQRYIERLNLTEAQVAKIKPILDKVQADVNEIRRQATIDTAAVLAPIITAAETDLKKLLTAEQNAQLGDLQKNRALSLDNQGRSRGGPPNRGGPDFGGSSRRGGSQNFNGPGGQGQRGPGGRPGQERFVPPGQPPAEAPAPVPAPAPAGN
jgi:Spy/CpxP family protein refolding chaperone